MTARVNPSDRATPVGALSALLAGGQHVVERVQAGTPAQHESDRGQHTRCEGPAAGGAMREFDALTRAAEDHGMIPYDVTSAD